MLRLEADINGVAAKIVEDFKHSEEFPATSEKVVKRFKTSEEFSIGFAKEFANGSELFWHRSFCKKPSHIWPSCNSKPPMRL